MAPNMAWSFEEACMAAGLEVSVSRWWNRPQPGTFLRKTLRRGIQPGCRQLLRWGVPQHVLTSGGQLGEYLAGDLALRGQFQQVAADSEGVPAWFLSQMVSNLSEAFEIRYRTSLSQSGLVLVPRAVSAPPLSPLPSEPEASEEAAPEMPAPKPKPKALKMKAVRRALTLTSAERAKEPPFLPPRPATVDGATSSIGLPNLRQKRPPQRRRTQSSFSLWTARKTQDFQEHKQLVQRHLSSRKVDASSHRVKKALPLNMSKKHVSKIVQDQGELKRIFDYYDRDSSGFIDPEEFPMLLQRILKQPVEGLDRKEMWEIWDEIDDDGSGHVSFEEFQKWYCRAFRIDGNPDRTSFFSPDQVPAHDGLIRSIAKKLNLDYLKVDSLWTRFTTFDIDKNGSLDYDEFTRLIQKELSPSGTAVVPDKVVKKFWIEVDVDNSGLINFAEFCAWYRRFLFGGKSPMEQYYANFGTRGSMVMRSSTKNL